MRKERGITLVSLIIYIVVMTIAVGIMSSIVDLFYKNTETVQGNVRSIVEFNKFNNYFLKEIKAPNNKVDNVVNDSYILFASGNSFSISEGAIYYNDTRVCDRVKSMIIKVEQDENKVYRDIVNVTLNFEDFNKSINYKLENIY